MVLTEQNEDICYIAATVEDSRYTTEDDIYDIINGRRIAKTTVGATQSSFEDKLYRVHGGLTNEKTGLGMVLKVMSGDQVKITAESYYTMPGGGPGSPSSLGLTELLTSMIGTNAVTSGDHSTLTTSDISGAWGNSTDLANFVGNNAEGSNNARAFVCWILFNEQFKYVTGGADPVQSGGGYKQHTYFINNPVSVTKNGYMYIYVSNESNLAVYFDNLNVTHTPGPVLEETHYYPFGLTMNGVSSKANAFSGSGNKVKYNGKEEQNNEFLDGSGLEWLDYGARMYAPDIGRWNGIDLSSEKYLNQSPYHFSGNNPILFLDLNGNDYGVSVNRANKTITITAHYFASDASIAAVNKYGKDKWNGQSEKNVFITGSIKDLKKGRAEGYKIKIALTTEVINGENYATNGTISSYSPRDECAHEEGSKTYNSVDVISGFAQEDQLGGAGGKDITLMGSELFTGTTTHEIDHTMGIQHFGPGGGTISAYGPANNVTGDNIGETLKGVGIGGNTIARNSTSVTGDGTLLNGSSEGLEKGSVISAKKYDRIMRRLERKK